MIVRGGGKGRGKNGTDRERKREERHFSLAFPVNDSPAIAGIPSTATITSRKRSLSRMVTLVEIEIWTSYFFLPFFLHSVPPLSLPCPSLRPMITRRIFVEFTLKNCAMLDRFNWSANRILEYRVIFTKYDIVKFYCYWHYFNYDYMYIYINKFMRVLIFHRNSELKKKKIKNSSSARWKRWRNFSSIIRMENLLLYRAIKKRYLIEQRERERKRRGEKMILLAFLHPLFFFDLSRSFFSFEFSASQKNGRS